MMYNVTIQEILARTVQVEANSRFDAEMAVRDLYYNSDIVLDDGDYVLTEFKVDANQPFHQDTTGDITLFQDDSWERP